MPVVEGSGDGSNPITHGNNYNQTNLIPAPRFWNNNPDALNAKGRFNEQHIANGAYNDIPNFPNASMPGSQAGNYYHHPNEPGNANIRDVKINNIQDTHPEWRGSVPSKWMDSKSNRISSRKIVNTGVRNGDLTRMGLGPFAVDPKGLERVDGRKYIPGKQYPEAVWRPSCNKVIEISGYDRPDRPEGVKRLPILEDQKPRMRHEKRHLRQVEGHQEFYDVNEGKTIVQWEMKNPHSKENPTSIEADPIRMRRCDKTATEITLENEVQTKKRIPETMLEQRNGIPCKSLGDKFYKHPEYSHRFFYNNELIPGSGFVRGSYPKTIARNSTEWQAFGAENTEAGQVKSYAQKMRETEQKAAEDSIRKELEVWQNKELAFADPNYKNQDSDDEEEANFWLKGKNYVEPE